jgi:pimeloyl-ACP methyl ester carboxylesterase
VLLDQDSVDALSLRRSGSGEPVVLLHGVAGSGAIWEAMVPALAQDLDVWRLDLLGYGYSPKPKLHYTAKVQLEAIHRTLQARNIPKPYSLIGLSMGAMLALEYAAAYPNEVKAVIAIGLPYYESADEARRSMRHSFWTRLVVEYPLLARALIGLIWPLGRRSRWIRVTFAPKFYSDRVSRETMMATYQSFASNVDDIMIGHRVAPALSRLSLPTLFIHGEVDQWTTVARLRAAVRQVRGATVAVIPNARHNVVALNPDETARLCRAFILKLSRGA